MDVTSRFERKYHLSPGDYVRVRNAVRLWMRRDQYTIEGGGRYLVRSLYFDTRDLSAFRERTDGVFGRIKPRIRVYSDTQRHTSRVRVELKTRKGSVMEKHFTFVPYSDYLAFMRSWTWRGTSDPVLEEFARLLRTREARPILLVQYHREGFRSRDGSPVRVTVDHNVCSSRAGELFPRHLLLRTHRPTNIILEIKTRGHSEPGWLREIVRSHSLKLVSNSKYVQGIEVVRPAMVTPRMII